MFAHVCHIVLSLWGCFSFCLASSRGPLVIFWSFLLPVLAINHCPGLSSPGHQDDNAKRQYMVSDFPKSFPICRSEVLVSLGCASVVVLNQTPCSSKKQAPISKPKKLLILNGHISAPNRTGCQICAAICGLGTSLENVLAEKH